MMRDVYGQTRWDRAKIVLFHIMNTEKWDYSNPDAMGTKVIAPRVDDYKDTSLKEFFPYMEENLGKMLKPRLTFYRQFLTDLSHDAHFFGGIGAEVLGTFYLVLGAMLFAIPIGVIAAIFLSEFSKEGKIVSLLRVCISTQAGVPSIVFGLFGLASLLTEQRKKEMGIRKVLGASTAGIFTLLSRRFILTILAANVIAAPLGYFITRLFLGFFVYRIGFDPFVIVASSLITILVSLMTVGYQVLKTARVNPSECLRYE